MRCERGDDPLDARAGEIRRHFRSDSLTVSATEIESVVLGFYLLPLRYCKRHHYARE